MKNIKFEIKKFLDFKCKNFEILKRSLIHKSYDSKINNEKLEFLGDRVLGLVISKKLIDTYPTKKKD